MIAVALVAAVVISGRDGSVEQPAARAASSSSPSEDRFRAVLGDGRKLTLAICAESRPSSAS